MDLETQTTSAAIMILISHILQDEQTRLYWPGVVFEGASAFIRDTLP
jgi:hypothetical protein